MSSILTNFFHWFSQLFGLLNNLVWYDPNTGQVIRYGWLIIAFAFIGFLITVFWRGSKA